MLMIPPFENRECCPKQRQKTYLFALQEAALATLLPTIDEMDEKKRNVWY